MKIKIETFIFSLFIIIFILADICIIRSMTGKAGILNNIIGTLSLLLSIKLFITIFNSELFDKAHHNLMLVFYFITSWIIAFIYIFTFFNNIPPSHGLSNYLLIMGIIFQTAAITSNAISDLKKSTRNQFLVP